MSSKLPFRDNITITRLKKNTSGEIEYNVNGDPLYESVWDGKCCYILGTSGTTSVGSGMLISEPKVWIDEIVSNVKQNDLIRLDLYNDGEIIPYQTLNCYVENHRTVSMTMFKRTKIWLRLSKTE